LSAAGAFTLAIETRKKEIATLAQRCNGRPQAGILVMQGDTMHADHG